MGFIPRPVRLSLLAAMLTLAAIFGAMLWPAPVVAQTAAAPAAASAPAVTDQDVDQLTAMLGDPAARDKLIRQLRALKAARTAGQPAAEAPPVVEPRGLGATLVTAMAAKLKQLGDGLSTGVEAMSRLPEIGRDLAAEAADPAMRARWIDVAIKLAIVLGLALAGG